MNLNIWIVLEFTKVIINYNLLYSSIFEKTSK